MSSATPLARCRWSWAGWSLSPGAERPSLSSGLSAFVVGLALIRGFPRLQARSPKRNRPRQGRRPSGPTWSTSTAAPSPPQRRPGRSSTLRRKGRPRSTVRGIDCERIRAVFVGDFHTDTNDPTAGRVAISRELASEQIRLIADPAPLGLGAFAFSSPPIMAAATMCGDPRRPAHLEPSN